MEVKDTIRRHFDDAPIGRRLKTAFFGIAGAILVVTCIALVMLADQRQRIEELSGTTIGMIESSWASRISLDNIKNSVIQLSMTKDEVFIKKYEQELADAKSALYKELDYLGDRISSKYNKDELSSMITMFQNMQDIEKQVIEYGRNGQQEDAVKLLESSYLPTMINMNDFLEDLCAQIETDKDQFIQGSYNRATVLMILLIVISVIIMIQAGRLSKRTIHGITDPLLEVEKAMEALERGELSYELTYHSKNEIGKLAHKIRGTEKELARYVNNISYVTRKIADRDFTVTVDIDYRGDFEEIKTSFGKILAFLNKITTSIRETSNGVREGSEQISEVSQGLADGATEQSGTVEELQASLSDVSKQVEVNAENVQEVSTMASEAQIVINKGNEHMRELVAAMDEISQSSEQIQNIIGVIEGISGQTNMLALNASIEAARAGEQGRGFAVVAGEIGSLATDTKKATKTTTDLIHQSLDAVQKGVVLVNETAEILKMVVQSASKITNLADEVSGASTKQASTIDEIYKAVEQISSVVQDNASIAQEAASSSEELTAHATVLSDILQDFKL